ncbi:MAG: peroxiredoxin-like family protein [Planctomycetota bacterium]
MVESNDVRPWMRTTLFLAAAYNLLWGAWVILRPGDFFQFAGIEPPRYLGIWQCVGMIVGVYGVGYAIAARDPIRHWPITLVGFLGKIFGPIGFLFGLLSTSPGDPGRLPLSWGLTIITNDLIWWLPFAAILYAAFRHHSAPPETERLTVQEANQTFRSQHGKTLAELSEGRLCLVLFLRHSGCTFCREALADMSKARAELAQEGVMPVLVHMGQNDDQAQQFFDSYDLGDLDRISDPDCQLYRAYDLQRGTFWQVMGPAVWWPGAKAFFGGHFVGKLVGDGFQMAGMFTVRDGRVVREHRHETSADRPAVDRMAMAE